MTRNVSIRLSMPSANRPTISRATIEPNAVVLSASAAAFREPRRSSRKAIWCSRKPVCASNTITKPIGKRPERSGPHGLASGPRPQLHVVA